MLARFVACRPQKVPAPIGRRLWPWNPVGVTASVRCLSRSLSDYHYHFEVYDVVDTERRRDPKIGNYCSPHTRMIILLNRLLSLIMFLNRLLGATMLFTINAL